MRDKEIFYGPAYQTEVAAFLGGDFNKNTARCVGTRVYGTPGWEAYWQAGRTVIFLHKVFSDIVITFDDSEGNYDQWRRNQLACEPEPFGHVRRSA
jgi:hypothetical protein